MSCRPSHVGLASQPQARRYPLGAITGARTRSAMFGPAGSEETALEDLGSQVVVIMPVYNAALAPERTYADIPQPLVERIILVDDVSGDRTVEIAHRLGLDAIVHWQNLGYGGTRRPATTPPRRLTRGSWSSSIPTTCPTRSAFRS
jgi:hypothetical protein